MSSVLNGIYWCIFFLNKHQLNQLKQISFLCIDWTRFVVLRCKQRNVVDGTFNFIWLLDESYLIISIYLRVLNTNQFKEWEVEKVWISGFIFILCIKFMPRTEYFSGVRVLNRATSIIILRISASNDGIDFHHCVHSIFKFCSSSLIYSFVRLNPTIMRISSFFRSSLTTVFAFFAIFKLVNAEIKHWWGEGERKGLFENPLVRICFT